MACNCNNNNNNRNSKYLIGTKNIGTQTVPAGGEVNIGNTYRKYCRKNNCGVKVFDNTATGTTAQWDGMYHVTAILVGTAATEAGDVSMQLFQNGVPVTGAISTQTITTPATEFRTFVIDYFILVDTACILGVNSTLSQNLTLENVGTVDATFTSVVFNVVKED